MKNKIIEVRNLSFSYGDEPVLSQLQLTVEAGDFAAVIGANGVGKSTLFSLLLGQLKPSGGQIRLFDGAPSDRAVLRRVAYISQHAVQGYRHFPTTIEEAVRVHLRLLHKKQPIRPLLQRVGLEELGDRRLCELSGGQLQRVALLLAVLKEAELILLDEPTTGIDQAFAGELYRLLRGLVDAGRTVVMVTHHPEAAYAYINRLYELHNGQIGELPLTSFDQKSATGEGMGIKTSAKGGTD
ncbi:MAG: metal ABC transporter ATP-binding protein [Lachnospiraceae bacterium]|nr:metal ABC transporter ATP-binding protein [Lachnospiraceae bacterium]MDY5742656.1 metal ABC transporter ATP-binding protein [Lachnospiraceae bacterium]